MGVYIKLKYKNRFQYMLRDSMIAIQDKIIK